MKYNTVQKLLYLEQKCQARNINFPQNVMERVDEDFKGKPLVIILLAAKKKKTFQSSDQRST